MAPVRPITTKIPVASRIDDLRTASGTARAHHFPVAHGVPRASLIYGHGGSAGVAAPDLATLAAGLPPAGIEVVLVEQPWFVEERPKPDSKPVLDSVWTEAVAQLRRGGIGLRRLAVGGHGVGARVACRTAAITQPEAVLCTAFPLWHPRKADTERSAELASAAAVAPVTVVQGTEDRFGSPAEIAGLAAQRGARVLTVALPFVDHSFFLSSAATITDSEARMVLVGVAQRSVLRGPGNTGPLLTR
jgi:predicted alpha/beta-hydrolase family hydrolase